MPLDSDQLEQLVLKFVLRPNYQPVKPKVIAKKLNLGPDQKKPLRRAIQRLVKQGRLSYGRNHIVRPPSVEDAGRITGTFRRIRGRSGIVRTASAAEQGRQLLEVFIPPRDAGDAATGDTVTIRITGPAKRGHARPQGRVEKILQRNTEQFVGTYQEHGDYGFVQIDGTQFPSPVWVGDPGAKGAHPGDKVVIEMIRFPTAKREGEGVITEVLGAEGDPGVETKVILREFNLPEEFPEGVLDSAREQAQKFDESIPPDRLDLTAATIITIDPKDARDFDDAIGMEMLDNGHYRLGVHIADVAHFVQQGSLLDQEARDRATSVYLPGQVIPMLPELISNGLASLQPDRPRYTMSAFIEFTPEGTVVTADFARSVICSKRRFTYEEVDEYLADPEGWREKLTPEVHELLGRMRDLARVLRRRRQENGAIELALSEVKVELDKQGSVVGAHVVEQTESHQIIEEFMLSANEAVAEHLAEEGLLFLRRVHPSPDPLKIETLEVFLRDLGFEIENLQDRFELQRVLDQVADKPECHSVNYAVLRSFARAVYSPEEEGHYALASSCYCHFTSPIRRYPDLTVHRQLAELLAGVKPESNAARLAALGDHCSQRERRADDAERELTRLKLLHYFSSRIGTEMDAVLTGVEEFGLFAEGIPLPVEGLIPLEFLPNDYYYFDRDTHSLFGQRTGVNYRLGDRVRVSVASVDLERRELDFRLVASPPHPPPPSQGQKKRKSKPGEKSKSRSKQKRKSKSKGKSKSKKKR